MLKLLASARSGEEIAAELAMSPDTVRAHVQIILAKLQVRSRLDPPPLPPAAAAALAVPRQRAEDIPRHIGRIMRLKPGSS